MSESDAEVPAEDPSQLSVDLRTGEFANALREFSEAVGSLADAAEALDEADIYAAAPGRDPEPLGLSLPLKVTINFGGDHGD